MVYVLVLIASAFGIAAVRVGFKRKAAGLAAVCLLNLVAAAAMVSDAYPLAFRLAPNSGTAEAEAFPQ